MDRTKGVGAALRKAVRRLCIGAGALTTAWLLVTALTLFVTSSPPVAPAGGHTGWGSEALNAVGERAFALAPLPVANACGMGASSCFKCHNGSRAAAPKMDKIAAPWHPDHKTVNDSCAGCHGGNARIIKKEIAHGNLARDPRARAEACTACHKSGNAPALLKSYQAASSGGKKP